jgi:hypothetical protein
VCLLHVCNENLRAYCQRALACNANFIEDIAVKRRL